MREGGEDDRPEEGSASDREGRAMSQEPAFALSLFLFFSMGWLLLVPLGIWDWGGGSAGGGQCNPLFCFCFFLPFLSDLP
jgi:hypothetical protein